MDKDHPFYKFGSQSLVTPEWRLHMSRQWALLKKVDTDNANRLEGIHQSYCPHHGDYGRTDGKTECPECEDASKAKADEILTRIFSSFQRQLDTVTISQLEYVELRERKGRILELEAEVAALKAQIAAMRDDTRTKEAPNPLHRAISRNHNVAGLRRPEGM